MLNKAIFKYACTFRACRRGVFGIVAAILLPVVILGIGLGVDYAYLWTEITRAKQAADFAVLSATRVARNSLATEETIRAAAIRVAQQGVIANRDLRQKSYTDATGANLVPQVTVTRRNDAYAVDVRLTYPIPSIFGRFVGVKTYNVDVTASATTTKPLNYNITFVIDNSGSMLIGSSPEMLDKTRSYNQKSQCVFACHTADHYTVYKARAAAEGTKLEFRIDAVREAVRGLLVRLQEIAGPFAQNYTVSIFMMAGTTIKAIDRRPISEVLSQLDSVIVPAAPKDATLYNVAFEKLEKYFKSIPIGNGLTQDAPKHLIFFITDGVENANNHAYRRGTPSDKEGQQGEPPPILSSLDTYVPDGALNLRQDQTWGWRDLRYKIPDINPEGWVNMSSYSDPAYVEETDNLSAVYKDAVQSVIDAESPPAQVIDEETDPTPLLAQLITPKLGMNNGFKSRSVLQPFWHGRCNVLRMDGMLKPKFDRGEIKLAMVHMKFNIDKTATSDVVRFRWIDRWQRAEISKKEMTLCASPGLFGEVEAGQDNDLPKVLDNLLQVAGDLTMTR